MSSFNYIRRPTRTLSIEFRDYSKLLRRAADSSVELRRFESQLREVAVRRAHELSVFDDEAVQFAVNVLLPSRLRSAAQHLIREAVDAEALAGFLGCSTEVGVEQLAASDGAEDVADAVTGALDGLHSYLIAHNLVNDAYLTAERAFAARLLSAATPPEDVPPAQPDSVAESAAKNDLALAA